MQASSKVEATIPLPGPGPAAEMSPTQTLVEEEENREGVGVPLLPVSGVGSPEEVLHAIESNFVTKLPTPAEVSGYMVDTLVA